MLLYNLLKYYTNSTKTTESLYHYASDKANADTTDFTSFHLMYNKLSTEIPMHIVRYKTIAMRDKH